MNRPMSRQEFLSNSSQDAVDFFTVYLTTEKGRKGVRDDINTALKELHLPATAIISIVPDLNANCFLVFYRC